MALVFWHHLVALYIERYQPFGVHFKLPQDWYKAAALSGYVNLASRAGFGVQLFFVISGFVLALPFLRAAIDGGKRPGLAAFYARRLWRLEPPYLIALTIALARLVLVEGKPLIVFLPHWAASAVYQHNLLWDTPSWVLGIAWSLEVEAQFYIAMPLLAWLLFPRDRRSRRLRVAALIVAGGLLSQLYFEADPGARLRMSVLNFLQYFGAGFLLADWHLSEWRRGESARPGAWDLVGAASALALTLVLAIAPDLSSWGLPQRWLGGSLQLLLPWATLAFCAAALRGRAFRWAFTRRWVVIAGGMCYTFYLYHWMFLEGLLGPAYRLVGGRLGLEWEASALYAVCFCATLLGTAVLFALFEKPFMGRRPRAAQLVRTT